MTALMKLLTAVLCCAALAACGDLGVFPAAEKEKADPPPAVVSVEDALFCFKCHARDAYEGKGGGYSHTAHREMMKDMVGVLHCNQCHDVRGHAPLKTVSKAQPPCSACH